MESIGTHIPKIDGSYTKSLKRFLEKYPDNITVPPVQIFTGAPDVWKRPKVNDNDKKNALELMKERNLKVYIHSCYLINLCWESSKFDEKVLPVILEEFSIGKSLNFSGVVIHCGKRLKVAIESALDVMEENIRKILPSASEDCPFILETSAAQGTEVLHQCNELVKFYNRFSEEEKKVLKICVDTCHVFAAGHEPLDFIKELYDNCATCIELIHFNDSAYEKGKKKDRHAFPGTGYIGIEKLTKISEWCLEKNISMLVE